MEIVIKEVIIALLASPDVRLFFEELAIKVMAEVMHRRAIDPAFLVASDAAFKLKADAKTPEEITNAQNAIRLLGINSG